MSELNWHDASKELPENDGPVRKLCFVTIKYENSTSEIHRAIVYDWYNPTALLSEDEEEYIGEWDENDGEVTH